MDEVIRRFIDAEHLALDSSYRFAAEKALGRVDRSNPDGCWEWPGSHDGFGYGMLRIKLDGKWITRRVHRVVAVGLGLLSPDSEAIILHTCDNPPCINPRHFRFGSRADNNADRDRKGRQRSLRGSAHYSAKLSEEVVHLARQMHANGLSATSLAARFEVHLSTMCRALKGETWKQVTP